MTNQEHLAELASLLHRFADVQEAFAELCEQQAGELLDELIHAKAWEAGYILVVWATVALAALIITSDLHLSGSMSSLSMSLYQTRY